MYAFTLRAAILCGFVSPSSFPTPIFDSTSSYARYPSPLRSCSSRHLTECSSGWCAHYGHSHASAQLNCGILPDCPARLLLVLVSLFNRQNKALMCVNRNTFPVDAAICLICGTTVCLQSNCCIDEDYNNRGECNMHT